VSETHQADEHRDPVDPITRNRNAEPTVMVEFKQS